MRAKKKSFQFHSPTAEKKLSALNPTKRNPRILSAERRARLKKSLCEYGDLSSIIYNRRTDELVGGNQRVSEFKSDPDAKVTITERLRRPDRCGTVAFGYVLANGTRYGYREVDWPADRAMAANLAANKHGGEFDLPVVAELLEELAREQTTDLDLTGFTSEELDDLLNAADPVKLKPIPTQAPPKMSWALIGIPTVRFGEISSHLEKIAALKDVILQTTANNGPDQNRQQRPTRQT